jgi:hypothetical protein
MRERGFTLPELFFVGGTRFALGLGAGLLLAGKLGPAARKGAGRALTALGILSSVPIIIGVLRKPTSPGTGTAGSQ